MKKKPLFLFLFLMVVGMMTINVESIQAQESTVMISFIDEEGYTVDYDLTTLVSLIATSDTLVDDDGWFMREYESVFPAMRGSHEPAILVLLPIDDYFYSICIQQNKRGKLLSFRVLTKDGWLDADMDDLETLQKIMN